eukprot:COSAG02_NODE_394_length_23152_cov_13.232204_15_plen_182_part_00
MRHDLGACGLEDADLQNIPAAVPTPEALVHGPSLMMHQLLVEDVKAMEDVDIATYFKHFGKALYHQHVLLESGNARADCEGKIRSLRDKMSTLDDKMDNIASDVKRLNRLPTTIYQQRASKDFEGAKRGVTRTLDKLKCGVKVPRKQEQPPPSPEPKRPALRRSTSNFSSTVGLVRYARSG